MEVVWSMDSASKLQSLLSLTFMGPGITNIFSSITNKIQRYTIYVFL